MSLWWKEYKPGDSIEDLGHGRIVVIGTHIIGPVEGVLIEGDYDEAVRVLSRKIRGSLSKCSVPPIEVPPIDMEAAVRGALASLTVGDRGQDHS